MSEVVVFVLTYVVMLKLFDCVQETEKIFINDDLFTIFFIP